MAVWFSLLAWGEQVKESLPENKNLLIDHAYQLFRHHLEQLRQYADIKTICMFNDVFILQV